MPLLTLRCALEPREPCRTLWVRSYMVGLYISLWHALATSCLLDRARSESIPGRAPALHSQQVLALIDGKWGFYTWWWLNVVFQNPLEPVLLQAHSSLVGQLLHEIYLCKVCKGGGFCRVWWFGEWSSALWLNHFFCSFPNSVAISPFKITIVETIQCKN